MKIFPLINDELSETLWVRVRGQTKVVGTTVCACYRMPDLENADKTFT